MYYENNSLKDIKNDMKKTIEIMVDSESFEHKPEGLDISQIQQRLKNNMAIKNLSIEQLFNCISQGRTIVPGIMENGVRTENFIRQQLIMIDIDNAEDEKVVTPNEVIELLEKVNIHVLGYYYTFSSMPEKPKFRVLLLLDKPIGQVDKVEFILKTLIEYIPQADPACKNVSRLFFGTSKDKETKIVNAHATFTFEDVLELWNSITKPVKYSTDTNLNELIKNFDLLEYIKKDAEINEKKSNNNYKTFKVCPICKHNDDLVYFTDTNSFKCFGAHGGNHGNIINYLMARDKLNKNKAEEYFKYEILNLPRENMISKDLSSEDLTIIKTQLDMIGLNSETLESVNWLSYNINKKGELIYTVVCPLLAEFIRKNLHYIFVRNNAKSGVLRYFYINGYYKLITDDELRGLIKACIPLEYQKTKDINEVLGLLYTDLKFVPIEQLNADENIINFNNGVLHLDTMELKPHSPDYLSSIRIPCNYYKDVPAPSTHYYDNFISTLTGDREELKTLIQQIMGVVISNVCGYHMKQALFMVGDGDTGKSVMKLFLTNLIGPENFSSVDLKNLETKFGKILMLNKRLVGTNDMSYMNISELETFKQATGGDPINAEFKGENAIDFIFKGVMWFCGNKLAKFGGDKGDWVYNRVIIIKCDNVVPEEKRDRQLVKHLLEEKEYIVSLAIRGLKQVIDNGYRYDIPDICKKWLDKYKVENDSFLSFFNECLIERNPEEIIKDNCTCGKIFEVYRAYCSDNNKGHFNTKAEVKNLLEKMGKADKVKTNGGNVYYKYLTLRPEVKIEYKKIYGDVEEELDVFKDADKYYTRYDTVDSEDEYPF